MRYFKVVRAFTLGELLFIQDIKGRILYEMSASLLMSRYVQMLLNLFELVQSKEYTVPQKVSYNQVIDLIVTLKL